MQAGTQRMRAIWAKTRTTVQEAFGSRRVGFMAPLGFSSGLPLSLTGSTLTAWMATQGVDLTTVGIFAWVSLPYSVKFLWAPLLDRFQLPWLSRRRGWMLLSQLVLLGSIVVLGCFDPVRSPSAVALMAFTVAFFSATQDIVIDAYRTDVLRPVERASGVAIFVACYRVALIVSGAGALILSEFLPWRQVYHILAGFLLVGVVSTFLAPSPDRVVCPPKSLSQAVVRPLSEFFQRPHAATYLAVALTFKVGDAVASHMLMPFLIGLGFGRAEIGAVSKGLGLAATIVGSLIGGGLVARFGLRSSLLAFGMLQAVSNLLYAVLAGVGQSHVLLVVSIGVDNLFNGLGTAAFVAFLMSLCRAEFSATQYALLSSAGSLLGRLLAGGSGWIASQVGWTGFFVLTLVVALPALLLLAILPRGLVGAGPTGGTGEPCEQ